MKDKEEIIKILQEYFETELKLNKKGEVTVEHLKEKFNIELEEKEIVSIVKGLQIPNFVVDFEPVWKETTPEEIKLIEEGKYIPKYQRIR